VADEHTRIARIRELLSRGAPPSASSIALGIGDDAAVLEPMTGRIVLSVDASVEHVHFERAFANLDVLADRAFSAALSDLAAMGATPRAALSALILPSTIGDAELDTLVLGLARAAQRYEAPIVGGNLSRGGELSMTTTVIGEARGSILTRSGAREGDSVHVTGTLGGAALGLALLQAANATEHAEAFIARFREPHARITEGLMLTGVATACIDVSDGLVQDLSQVCAASGVGAEIDSTRLPTAPHFARVAASLGRDPVELALCGGEDYELLYTLPAGTRDPTGGTAIGRIVAAPVGTVSVRGVDGQPIAVRARGHQHFR
jgi:thiamine-monophosphate kinase